MFIDKCPASAASQYFVKCWKDILGKRMQLILLIWFDIQHANYLTQLTKLKKRKRKELQSSLIPEWGQSSLLNLLTQKTEENGFSHCLVYFVPNKWAN